MERLPQKSLRERIESSVFDEQEFMSMAQDWLVRGWISNQQFDLLAQTLATDEVKKIIQTWLNIAPLSMGVTYLRETGSVGAGLATKSFWAAFSTYLSTLLIQSTVMASLAKRRLKGMDSEKIVPWLYFLPIVGDHAPLLYLSRNHPEFLRLLWAYRMSKGVWNNQKNSPQQGKLQSYLYQKIEAKKFKQGLNSMDRILGWAKIFWDRVDTVLDTTKKVVKSKPE